MFSRERPHKSRAKEKQVTVKFQEPERFFLHECPIKLAKTGAYTLGACKPPPTPTPTFSFVAICLKKIPCNHDFGLSNQYEFSVLLQRRRMRRIRFIDPKLLQTSDQKYLAKTQCTPLK